MTLKRIFKITFFACFCGIFSACHSNLDFKGHQIPQESFAALKAGLGKEEIINILGNPSTRSDFGSETWFYVSEKIEKTSYVRNNVLKREVVILNFSKDGKLLNFKKLENDQVNPLEFNEEKTPIKGDDTSLIKETFKNIGKFNKKPQIER